MFDRLIVVANIGFTTSPAQYPMVTYGACFSTKITIEGPMVLTHVRLKIKWAGAGV
jgi:hypothetical protein